MTFPDPREFGSDWDAAEAVAILLHGHGQTPDDMQALAIDVDCPDVRYILPAAKGGTWFPRNLLEPFEDNKAGLEESLAHCRAIVESLRNRGVAQDRIVLGGFAHGACVIAEFLVRNPRSYGGALILSGGLIDVAAIGRRPGSGLLAVPIYVSGSEINAVIPVDRTRGAIKTLQAGGALIRSHVFTDRAHGISPEDIIEARKLLTDVKQAAEPSA
ncbi:alpha/beta hydrolase [Methylocapsa acidiphila]|uniref:alpha/beta hydrolase n=1 Tax=Methylocapsa acidiphila TaxID=133552 RepID=UPI0003F4B5F9|nr:phospholipase/carboxylesterase [Methylocapsa acidiphila]